MVPGFKVKIQLIETGSVQVGFHKIQRKLGQSNLDSTRFKGGGQKA